MSETIEGLHVPDSYTLPKEHEFVLTKFAPAIASVRHLIVDFGLHEEWVLYLEGLARPHREHIEKWVDSMRTKKEPISFQTAIRLLGVKNVHDLLLARGLWEAVYEKPLDWSESGRPAIDPKEIIPKTIECRERFGEDSRHHFLASIAALVFDLLALFNEKQGVDVKRTRGLIDTQFKGALDVAQTGLIKARGASKLALEKYLVSTVLLKRAGRIVLSLLNPKYNDFADNVAKAGLRSRFVHVAEERAFGIANNMISCMLCKFVPKLEDMNPALLFYDYPYLLNDKMTGSDVYDLVSFSTDLISQSGTAEKD